MLIPIADAVRHTQIFAIILGVLTIVSLRRKSSIGLSKHATTELKGFAVLGVLFAHIGYALVTDTRFLFPLSVAAGVCLNAFLFLSGYGLTQSLQEKPLAAVPFYKRRLDKILLPFWIGLVVFLAADALLLRLSHPWQEIAQAFLGFFPRANLYENINSPLWYITFILGYYLLFPALFYRRAPIVTALAFAAIGTLLVELPIPLIANVRHLYKSHIYALPFGILTAWAVSLQVPAIETAGTRLRRFLMEKRFVPIAMRIAVAIVSGTIFCNLVVYHAAVGKGFEEQLMGLIALVFLLVAALAFPFESRFLMLFGTYSFEIYLLHWPILYRYDVIYKSLPASMATTVYLAVFLLLGYGLQRLASWRPANEPRAPSN